ncbi:cytochrome aa3 quinol oxidase subunit IV [Priestia endophytica]|uniref:Quinol oxidase subunit 4 n=2 Tax=Priestia endophytica TaxID=135735 RepID=A0A329EQM7_9BACI|nr:cytochrome aa3 quinol oxidase subunit IV [Priestia endophytica]KAB2496327.1 cytochrome aa3 quinol oxidase subunit IV [Priestia endophytica]MCM3536719.1 cytochrome aa3 quinol oxidase subunit IV [Priestia endophytica]MED4072357.1 cytochrome aa3 quinol oxidase subunit IV [Priestia endophytica]RAS72248.1 cytochrome aa3 quinol oxidase subunit IV [Priestia endophytica]RAS73924.1 cytochrome aa3 quinol oxidase subunit IV [Priestia endophytica]
MNEKENIQENHDRFPWKLVIGFVLSIVLTLLTLWVAFRSGFQDKMVLSLMLLLAFLQAGMQLVLFMHVREGEGTVQVSNMVHAFFTAIIIVAGSVWVMSFGMHNH